MPSLWAISRAVLQNLAMGLAPVRWLARRRHRTGLERDAALVGEVFAYLSSRARLEGKRILDFGMGRTPDLLVKALALGAKSSAAVDVAPYFSAEEARRLGIDYRLYGGRCLPWKDASFDVVWTWDVLQHVRRPAEALGEIGRVLAPGGFFLCRIDLRDHYHLADRAHWFDCLGYREILWNAMTSNRSSYVNRLRLSDWRKLFAEHGFEATEWLLDEDSSLLSFRDRQPFLRDLPEEDVRCWRFRAVFRKHL